MLKRKAIAAAIGGSLLFLTLATRAVASGECTPVYGGGVNCPRVDQSLDKVILNPATGQYVSGLGSGDPENTRFKPGQQVTFRIRVQNTGDQTQTVSVRDVLPPYTTFVSGPSNLETGSNTVNYSVSLTPGQSDERTVTIQVMDASKLPSDLLCGEQGVKNVAQSTMGDVQRSREVPFCINKGPAPTGVFVPSALPKAGAEDFIIGGFAALVSGGLYLINKTRRLVK